MMKKEEKPILLIAAILIAVVVYFFIEHYKTVKSLERNVEHTNAVIYDLSIGTRGRYYLKYYYLVDGIKYHGNGKWYPKSDTLSVKDTIVIIYDRTNNGFSKPERDFLYK